MCRSRVESGAGESSSSTSTSVPRPYFTVVPLDTPHRDPASRRPLIRRRGFHQDPPRPPTPTEIPYATLRTPPTAGAFPSLPLFDRMTPWATPVPSRTTGADATATAATNPNAGLGANPSVPAAAQNNGSPRSDTATVNSTNSRTANNNADTTNTNASGPRNPSEPWNSDEYRNPWE